jgi:hypothetical protein
LPQHRWQDRHWVITRAAVSVGAVLVALFLALVAVRITETGTADLCGPVKTLRVGSRLFCTHGPDQAAPFCLAGVCPFPLQLSPPPSYACVDGWTSGDRIQVHYAYLTGTSPRPDFERRSRDAAAATDAIFVGQTAQHFRFVCDAGGIAVKPVAVKDGTLGSFIAAVNERRSDRFYLAFNEASSGGGWATGSAQDESSDSARHRGPQYSIVAGFGAATAVHELGHNLGAVALSAPHSTGFWHCWDERDIMCYADGGPTGKTTVQICSGPERFDCNRDDYAGHSRQAWDVLDSLFVE